ncbi:MAG: methyltransferase domain-containing protein [Planctomycetes bacterium]|nr:methyltransferase domain-containing protein [Planctomycetota bacterium]
MPFEFDAEKYKKASTHQKEWGRKLISQLQLKGDEKILDLGCGDGGITAQLAPLVPDGLVIGIDASHKMIDSADKTHKGQNLRFDRIDINEIDFENEFDVVISNATLHWIKDHNKLLSNVSRALKNNGTARFNFAADGNCSTFYKVVRQIMSQKKYTAYFDRFDWPWYMPTIQEYEKLLANAKFTESKVWGHNADRYFPDKDVMIGWIDQPSLVPFLKCIDDTDKQPFRNAVVDQMVKETIQDDGTCFETFRRINVFAKA